MVLPPLIVTRPRGQHQALVTALQGEGLEVYHRPLIDIHSIADDHQTAAQRIRQKIINIDHYQGVIAISLNAAETGLHWLDKYWPQPPVGIEWLGVGPTTAVPFQYANIPIKIPTERFDSEGLLERPELAEQQIRGTRWLIWRGVGGRETLANVMRQRGASVDYAELYERLEIPQDLMQWQPLLKRKPWIVLSSGQALDILEQQIPQLWQHVTGILVPSERVASTARRRGYPTVLVAASARNADTLGCIKEHLL